MIERETNKIRLARRKDTCEIFTPHDLVDIMLDELPGDAFTDFSKTFCEPCAGNGNFVIAILERRLNNCHSEQDILSALSTIYAVELMQDNVDEMKKRILTACWSKYDNIYNKRPDPEICHEWENIVNHNIVCSDFFNWDFENWKPN